MGRTKDREKAFQTLFQLDINHDVLSTDSELHDANHHAYTKKLIAGVIKYKNEIDTIIINHLENWSFERLASVEKAVLRIAIYEMNYEEDVPIRVSINEAVEIANTFGDNNSGKFVNGVLSKIIK